MAIKKPIKPHPGKVKTQASTISFTTPQFTLETLFAAPTPMIAVVFIWVVLTGYPRSVTVSKLMTAAKSEEKP